MTTMTMSLSFFRPLSVRQIVTIVIVTIVIFDSRKGAKIGSIYNNIFYILLYIEHENTRR